MGNGRSRPTKATGPIPFRSSIPPGDVLEALELLGSRITAVGERIDEMHGMVSNVLREQERSKDRCERCRAAIREMLVEFLKSV